MQAIDANLPVKSVAATDYGVHVPTLPAPPVPEVKAAAVKQAGSVHQEAPDAEQVKKAIAQANAALKAASSTLEFTEDASTGRTLVRIIDSATHQVIRQLPSEEMLSIARAIDRMQGLLLKEKA